MDPKTWDDVERLSLTDATVRYALRYGSYAGWSRERIAAALIVLLVEQRKIRFEEDVERLRLHQHDWRYNEEVGEMQCPCGASLQGRHVVP